jgi:type 1 glutamine amidotransferase
MSKPLAFSALCGVLAALSVLNAPRTACVQAAEPASAGTKQVLLVTGDDIPAHKWRETAPVVKDLLAQDSRLSVTVLEDLAQLDKVDLGKYDTVIVHFKNRTPEVPGAQARANLETYVRGGGGLVILHFASGAFQEWPDFVRLAGRVWNPKFRAHDPRGPFQVDIADAEHPLTKGLKSFETTDELYTCLDGDPPITVLATAISKVDHKPYPMAFILECGKGRTFHLVLGHDVQAFRAPEVGELLRRGTAWTAKASE